VSGEIYKDLPVYAFESVATWRAWLLENHTTQPGAWIKLAKKGTGVTTTTYEEARDTAIEFGWIDGLINAYDEIYYLTRFTPRKAKSNWSKVNCAVAERLIASGLMQPAGLAQVEAAKKDGRWEMAYDPPSKMAVPDDFQYALEHSPAAAEFFATLKSASRYAFLYRIQTAKTSETRAKWIEKSIEMLEAGEAYHLI